MKYLRWPCEALPDITTAGRFPLRERGFDTRYLATTHAVHLHLYPGRIRIAGEYFDLVPGSLTFSPARLPSSYDLPEPGHHWCVHFRPASGSSAAARLPWHLQTGTRREEFIDRFRTIASLYARSRETRGSPAEARLALLQARAAMLEFLLAVARLALPQPRGSAGPGSSRVSAAVDRVVQILGTRLTEKPTAADLAQEVGVSQNYLARHFRQRLGVTIPRYLLARRMDHARLLLTTTNLPINRIAARVGLPDPSISSSSSGG